MNLLIKKMKYDGKSVYPVAASGIAATLLEGGKTVHSAFQVYTHQCLFIITRIMHNVFIIVL